MMKMVVKLTKVPAAHRLPRSPDMRQDELSFKICMLAAWLLRTGLMICAMKSQNWGMSTRRSSAISRRLPRPPRNMSSVIILLERSLAISAPVWERALGVLSIT